MSNRTKPQAPPSRQEWIAISDITPDEGQVVLTRDKRGEERCLSYTKFPYHYAWYFRDGSLSVDGYTPTHWTYLGLDPNDPDTPEPKADDEEAMRKMGEALGKTHDAN